MNWRDVLGKLAPTAATLLAGPFAGLAVQAVGDAIGVSAATSDKIKTALENSQLTADQIVALRAAEDQIKVKLAELGIRAEELELADVANARAREIAVRDKTPQILAYVITVGFFGVLMYMLAWEVPASGRDALNIMLGALATAWIGIVGYFYGSTVGSARKTELLAQAGK